MFPSLPLDTGGYGSSSLVSAALASTQSEFSETIVESTSPPPNDQPFSISNNNVTQTSFLSLLLRPDQQYSVEGATPAQTFHLSNSSDDDSDFQRQNTGTNEANILFITQEIDSACRNGLRQTILEHPLGPAAVEAIATFCSENKHANQLRKYGILVYPLFSRKAGRIALSAPSTIVSFFLSFLSQFTRYASECYNQYLQHKLTFKEYDRLMLSNVMADAGYTAAFCYNLRARTGLIMSIAVPYWEYLDTFFSALLFLHQQAMIRRKSNRLTDDEIMDDEIEERFRRGIMQLAPLVFYDAPEPDDISDSQLEAEGDSISELTDLSGSGGDSEEGEYSDFMESSSPDIGIVAAGDNDSDSSIADLDQLLGSSSSHSFDMESDISSDQDLGSSWEDSSSPQPQVGGKKVRSVPASQRSPRSPRKQQAACESLSFSPVSDDDDIIDPAEPMRLTTFYPQEGEQQPATENDQPVGDDSFLTGYNHVATVPDLVIYDKFPGFIQEEGSRPAESIFGKGAFPQLSLSALLRTGFHVPFCSIPSFIEPGSSQFFDFIQKGEITEDPRGTCKPRLDYIMDPDLFANTYDGETGKQEPPPETAAEPAVAEIAVAPPTPSIITQFPYTSVPHYDISSACDVGIVTPDQDGYYTEAVRPSFFALASLPISPVWKPRPMGLCRLRAAQQAASEYLSLWRQQRLYTSVSIQSLTLVFGGAAGVYTARGTVYGSLGPTIRVPITAQSFLDGKLYPSPPVCVSDLRNFQQIPVRKARTALQKVIGDSATILQTGRKRSAAVREMQKTGIRPALGHDPTKIDPIHLQLHPFEWSEYQGRLRATGFAAPNPALSSDFKQLNGLTDIVRGIEILGEMERKDFIEQRSLWRRVFVQKLSELRRHDQHILASYEAGVAAGARLFQSTDRARYASLDSMRLHSIIDKWIETEIQRYDPRAFMQGVQRATYGPGSREFPPIESHYLNAEYEFDTLVRARVTGDPLSVHEWDCTQEQIDEFLERMTTSMQLQQPLNKVIAQQKQLMKSIDDSCLQLAQTLMTKYKIQQEEAELLTGRYQSPRVPYGESQEQLTLCLLWENQSRIHRSWELLPSVSDLPSFNKRVALVFLLDIITNVRISDRYASESAQGRQCYRIMRLNAGINDWITREARRGMLRAIIAIRKCSNSFTLTFGSDVPAVPVAETVEQLFTPLDQWDPSMWVLCEWNTNNQDSLTSWERADILLHALGPGAAQLFYDSYVQRISNLYHSYATTPALPMNAAARPQIDGLDEQSLRELVPTADLYPAQMVTIRSLALVWQQKHNLLLMDCAQLGKTLSIIVFLQLIMAHAHVPGPFLIVAPSSIIPQWQREFAQWGPRVAVTFWTNDSYSRSMAAQYAMKASVRVNGKETTIPLFQVMVAAHELFFTPEHLAPLLEFHWRFLIVDDAHVITTQEHPLFTGLRKFTYETIMAVTPHAFNQEQIFQSLLELIQPGKWSDPQIFAPILPVIRRKTLANSAFAPLSMWCKLPPVRQFFIRQFGNFVFGQSRGNVLTYGPLSRMLTLKVKPNAIQQQFIHQVLSEGYDMLRDEEDQDQRRALASKVYMKAVRLCTCPLISRDFCEEIGLLNKSGEQVVSDDEYLRILIMTSTKFRLLDAYVTRLVERGHRFVISSTQNEIQSALRHYFRIRGINVLFYQGKHSARRNSGPIKHFIEENPPYVGLVAPLCVLTFDIFFVPVDTVIFMDGEFDPWPLSPSLYLSPRRQPLIVARILSGIVEETGAIMRKRLNEPVQPSQGPESDLDGSALDQSMQGDFLALTDPTLSRLMTLEEIYRDYNPGEYVQRQWTIETITETFANDTIPPGLTPDEVLSYNTGIVPPGVTPFIDQEQPQVGKASDK